MSDTQIEKKTLYVLRSKKGGEAVNMITENDAVAAMWRSMDGAWEKVEVLVIKDSADLTEAVDMMARETALAKLTDKEKELLGLA